MGPEGKIEAYLVLECRKKGWICDKFSSPNKRGVPDRLVFIPFNILVLVELKAPGKKPTKLQEHDHRKRRELGFNVRVIDSKEGVDNFIKEME